jgi:hypothetical protein
MGVNAPAIPTFDPKDYEPKPLMPKTFTPVGEMVACQWVRGPEPINEGGANLFLPNNLRMEQSGIKHTTPILRVIAVGPEVKGIQEDDLMFPAGGITTLVVHYAGYEYVIIHQKGLLGVIDREHEHGLRERLKPVEN